LKHFKPFDGQTAAANLADFLDEFVKSVNRHALSQNQAEGLLPTYFLAPLRSFVVEDIEQNGLQAAITDLFRNKCKRVTESSLEAKVRNFKFDMENVRCQVYDYRKMILKLNPRWVLSDALKATKEKIMLQLPPESAGIISAKEVYFKKTNNSRPMCFDQWIDELLALGVRLPKAHVNALQSSQSHSSFDEAEFNQPCVPQAHATSISSEISEAVSMAMSEVYSLLREDHAQESNQSTSITRVRARPILKSEPA
jgi:hypothetical protein